MARTSGEHAVPHRRWLAAAVVALMLAAGVTANLAAHDPAAAQPAILTVGPEATDGRPHPLCALRTRLPSRLWLILATVLDVTCPPPTTTTTTTTASAGPTEIRGTLLVAPCPPPGVSCTPEFRPGPGLVTVTPVNGSAVQVDVGINGTWSIGPVDPRRYAEPYRVQAELLFPHICNSFGPDRDGTAHVWEIRCLQHPPS